MLETPGAQLAHRRLGLQSQAQALAKSDSYSSKIRIALCACPISSQTGPEALYDAFLMRSTPCHSVTEFDCKHNVSHRAATLASQMAGFFVEARMHQAAFFLEGKQLKAGIGPRLAKYASTRPSQSRQAEHGAARFAGNRCNAEPRQGPPPEPRSRRPAAPEPEKCCSLAERHQRSL